MEFLSLLKGVSSLSSKKLAAKDIFKVNHFELILHYDDLCQECLSMSTTNLQDVHG